MNLEEVLHRIPVLEIIGNKDREISELIFDSRKAVEHSLYMAIKGTISDGHDFINSSIEKGAIAIVCEHIPNEIKILNNPQFMDLMGISIETAQMWRDKGVVGYIKIKNKIYYRISDIQELLENNFKKSTNPKTQIK